MTDKTDFDYQHLAVREFMMRGGQQCSSLPFIPEFSIRKLRAKLILEEALETINKGLGLAVWVGGPKKGEIQWFAEIENCEFDTLTASGDCMEPPCLIHLADGCADLKVVTVGTEIACGINGKPIFEEVMRSNMTKDFSGAKRPDGKILKGPTYEPPNIERILREQGWKV